MKTLPLLFALTVLLAVPVVAQTHDRDRAAQVDALFEAWDRGDSPGAAVAVVEDGRLVLARGYGQATLEYDVPIGPETIFHVASVSKQFTAFAIVLLAEEGRLSLDDDIRQHLPEMPDFGHTVTLRHLIHHTSGLRDQWELLMAAGWRIDDVITQEQILSLLRHQRELNFEPGSDHLYSNSGYTLMAEIVTRVTGESFADWTHANIFEPLGMGSTHFHDDHRRVVPGRAYSYASAGEGYRNAPLNYANAGATSLFTTVTDLTRWLVNLETMAVGSPAVHAAMRERAVLTSGDTLSYAFALVHGTHRDEPVLQHGGADAGYRSYLIYLPERRLGAVVLANVSDFDPGAMARRVLDVFLGHEPDVPPAMAEVELRAVSLPLEHLKALVGDYVLDTGSRVGVLVEGTRVLVRFGAGEPAPAIAVGDDEFVLLDGGRFIRFSRGEDGAVSGLRVRIGSREFAGSRLPAVDPAELAEFAGNYHSSELGTSYTIVLSDDGLVAEHRRHPPASLTPAGDDRLVGDRWGMGSLQFTRDANGAIDGFLLSGSRVRDLRFERRVD